MQLLFIFFYIFRSGKMNEVAPNGDKTTVDVLAATCRVQTSSMWFHGEMTKGISPICILGVGHTCESIDG